MSCSVFILNMPAVFLERKLAHQKKLAPKIIKDKFWEETIKMRKPGENKVIFKKNVDTKKNT